MTSGARDHLAEKILFSQENLPCKTMRVPTDNVTGRPWFTQTEELQLSIFSTEPGGVGVERVAKKGAESAVGAAETQGIGCCGAWKRGMESISPLGSSSAPRQAEKIYKSDIWDKAFVQGHSDTAFLKSNRSGRHTIFTKPELRRPRRWAKRPKGRV